MMFPSKREILGYKPKKQNNEPPPWWGCLPVLIILALILSAAWQNGWFW